MKYYIRNKQNELIEATDAEPFTVAGFEDWMLFTHRTLNDDGNGLMEPPYYNTSEATTGLMFGKYGYNFRGAAQEATENTLNRKGKEQANRTLVRCLKRYGLING